MQNGIRGLLVAVALWGTILWGGGASPAAAQQQSSRTGQQLFESICQACHLPGGVGDPETYPALADNPNLANGSYPVLVVVRGLRAMPSFAAMLSDAEIAAVVNYIRTSFGNQYDEPVTAADVKASR